MWQSKPAHTPQARYMLMRTLKPESLMNQHILKQRQAVTSMLHVLYIPIMTKRLEGQALIFEVVSRCRV